MPGLKTIYSRDGTPLTDIRAAVVRSSLLNDIGEAVFYIATSSVKCRSAVLEYGNFILIQNDSLADWVGIIDTPRPWKNGLVEVRAFEVPYILQYRLAPFNTAMEGVPGRRFELLLNHANGSDDTLIRAGSVDMGGVSTSEVMSDSVYKHIKKIQTENNYDWLCIPVVGTAGKLKIYMHWMERAGIVTDLELSQGHNILYGDTPLEESGELVNSIHAIGDDNTTEITYTEEAPYGLREIRKTYSGLTDITALLSAAREDVKKYKEPSFSTPLTAVNVGQTFSNIRLGNIGRYKYTNVGFNASGLGMSREFRIEGYRFDENIGTCELFTGKVI